MKQAIVALKKNDPVMKKIIDQLGDLEARETTDYFYTLVDAIASQQLSGKASDAILGRLKALYPEHQYPLPEDILKTDDETLRSVGFSRPKIVYLKDLARNFQEGIIDPTELDTLPDEETIQKLIIVKGIGRWTAEIFLMSSLNRPDVLPADDLGIQKAVKLHYNLDRLPKPKEVIEIAEKWRPYRTVASRYLWKSLDFRLIAQ